jgi:hypothetical protein
MKNILKYFMAAVVLTGFASCEDEQDLQYVTPAASFQILTPQSGESVFLDPALPNNPGLVIAWEDMDYATPTEVTYTVQVAPNGSDFSNGIDVATTSNTYASITSEALNGAAVAAGLEAFVEGALDVRVKASLGTQGGEPAYSNVITYLVTPYVSYAFRDLYLVGSATPTGWDNTTATNMYALYRDGENADVYYYTGYFASGEFKMVETKGNWAPQYGSDNAGNILPRPTETDPDPSAFTVATAGYYSLMVNLADNTYTFAPYDASGAATYPTIGIIGTATPGLWDADTDMTQSTVDPHKWFIEDQFLTAGGELKFRANNAWDTNWGGPTSYSGLTTLNGGNIPIGITVSGTYDVWFNDLDGRYIYIPSN